MGLLKAKVTYERGRLAALTVKSLSGLSLERYATYFTRGGLAGLLRVASVM